jgi:hypothetical protein
MIVEGSKSIISEMIGMVRVFELRCDDAVTLEALIEIASERRRWAEARAVFNEIRQKTLAAEKRGDADALVQYAFEEICAKTLYNLSGSPAPFDADSAFWVIPCAVALGKRLGLTSPSQITPLLRIE